MFHLIAGTDPNNETREINVDAEGNIITMDYLHNKIHEGEMLVASHVFATVADDATVYIRQSVGSLKYLHSVLEFNSTGLWNFKSYVGTTYTADGTLLDQTNRKSDSEYVPDGLIYHTPTIDTLGTLRLDFDFGSGTYQNQSLVSMFLKYL